MESENIMNTRRQNVETPNGSGKVFKNDIEVATVRYSLRVIQEILISKSFAETSEVEGLQEITGNISVIDGERDLMGDSPYILHLADGRKWEFLATSGNPISGEFRAVNSGGKGLFR
jgi:hypothetical protein